MFQSSKVLYGSNKSHTLKISELAQTYRHVISHTGRHSFQITRIHANGCKLWPRMKGKERLTYRNEFSAVVYSK